MKTTRLVPFVLLAALAVPAPAAAQRDSFLNALVQFHQTLRGAYGDEGPQLGARLDEMAAALAAWDSQIRDAENQLRPRLKGADVQTALQVHTILASLYMERGRFNDALREFDADITIDSTRAALAQSLDDYAWLLHDQADYAGAVGYVDFAGNLDFCITIRTVVMAGRKACVHKGFLVSWSPARRAAARAP